MINRCESNTTYLYILHLSITIDNNARIVLTIILFFFDCVSYHSDRTRYVLSEPFICEIYVKQFEIKIDHFGPTAIVS